MPLAGNWPREGMIVDGALFPLKKWAHSTKESVGFYSQSAIVPTITASDWRMRGPNSKQQGIGEKLKFSLPTMGASEYKGRQKNRYKGSKTFRGAKMSEGLRTCKDDPIYLSPLFAEKVMGYSTEWTALSASVTQWSQYKPDKRLCA